MKKHLVFLFLATAGIRAFAAKPCEELKAEIAAKLDAKHIKSYQLDIVPADQSGKQVVGSCENGKKKVVYKRN